MSALANAFRLKMLAMNQQGRPDFAGSFAGSQPQQPQAQQGANPYAPAPPRPFAMPQQPGPVQPGPQTGPQPAPNPQRWTPPQPGPLQPVPRVSPELQQQQQQATTAPPDWEQQLQAVTRSQQAWDFALGHDPGPFARFSPMPDYVDPDSPQARMIRDKRFQSYIDMEGGE